MVDPSYFQVLEHIWLWPQNFQTHRSLNNLVSIVYKTKILDSFFLLGRSVYNFSTVHTNFEWTA